MEKLAITRLPTTWKLMSDIVANKLDDMCKAQVGIGKNMKAKKHYLLSTNSRPQKHHRQNIMHGQQERRLDAGTVARYSNMDWK